MRNVVIIGSGCAGLTAAIYAARANLKPLVIRGVEAGGQLTLTTLVENFPGFPKGVQGPELVELMQKQATEFGAEYLEGNVTKVDLSQRPFVLEVGQERIGNPHAHHRLGRFRETAGPGIGAQAAGAWRFHLRHL